MSSVRVFLGVLGGSLGLLYLAYIALLWAMQDRLIFPAPGGIDREALDMAAREQGAATLDLVAQDGTALYAWHHQQDADRLLIYLPGNAETVAENIGLHRLLLRDGWDVLALAYRGYPGSQGSPSERGLAMDALAAWGWATTTGGYSPDRIVVHGRSLGGGVAAHLAEGSNPAGLVMEATFVSARALAKRAAPIAPVDWLFRHPFDTVERAPRVGVPTLLLHSKDDEVVPIELGGRALAPFFAEATFVETERWGHGVCLPVADRSIRKAYLAFLERTVPRVP